MASVQLLCVLSVTLFAVGALAQAPVCNPPCKGSEMCLDDPASKATQCFDPCGGKCQATETCDIGANGLGSCKGGNTPPPPPPPPNKDCNPACAPTEMCVYDPVALASKCVDLCGGKCQATEECVVDTTTHLPGCQKKNVPPPPPPPPTTGPCDAGRNPCTATQKCFLDSSRTKAVCVQVLGPCDYPNNPCKLGDRCLIEPSTMKAICIPPRRPPNPCDAGVTPCMPWEQCLVNSQNNRALCRDDNDPCANVMCEPSEFCVVEPNTAQPICLQFGSGRVNKRVMGAGIGYLRTGVNPPAKPAVCSVCSSSEDCLLNPKRRAAVCVPHTA